MRASSSRELRVFSRRRWPHSRRQRPGHGVGVGSEASFGPSCRHYLLHLLHSRPRGWIGGAPARSRQLYGNPLLGRERMVEHVVYVLVPDREQVLVVKDVGESRETVEIVGGLLIAPPVGAPVLGVPLELTGPQRGIVGIGHGLGMTGEAVPLPLKHFEQPALRFDVGYQPLLEYGMRGCGHICGLYGGSIGFTASEQHAAQDGKDESQSFHISINYAVPGYTPLSQAREASPSGRRSVR